VSKMQPVEGSACIAIAGRKVTEVLQWDTGRRATRRVDPTSEKDTGMHTTVKPCTPAEMQPGKDSYSSVELDAAFVSRQIVLVNFRHASRSSTK